MQEDFNWDLCLICQENSGIKLRNPGADDPRNSISVFSTFRNSVNNLRYLGYQVPDNIVVKFTRLYFNERNAK